MFKIKDFTPVISGFTNCDTPNCYKVVPLWNLRYKTKIRLRKRTRGCSFFFLQCRESVSSRSMFRFFFTPLWNVVHFFSLFSNVFLFYFHFCSVLLFFLSLLFVFALLVSRHWFCVLFSQFNSFLQFCFVFCHFSYFPFSAFSPFFLFSLTFSPLAWTQFRPLSFLPCAVAPFCLTLLQSLFVFFLCAVCFSVFFLFSCLTLWHFFCFFSTSFSFVWLFSPFCFMFHICISATASLAAERLLFFSTLLL